MGKAKLLDVDAQLNKLAGVSRDALGMDEVKAILALSIDQLMPELRAAWQKLGVFEGDFSAEAAARPFLKTRTPRPRLPSWNSTIS